LAAEKRDGGKNRVIFFRTGDRRIARAGSAVLGAEAETAGRVLSGTLSPILNQSIGSALVPVSAAAGPLSVDIRGTRLPLEIVKPPFVELKKTALS
jgi:aminomethyltransferase